MRIPLDVRRRQGRSLQWRPFSLNDNLVQSNKELIDLLQFVSYVGQHVALPMPVLMDINVHYRLMKMCYGERMLQWDMRGMLRNHPPLFGVWHAYKHVLTVIHRQFHSLFVHFRHGPAPVGETFHWTVAVRTMEYYVGALLQLPSTGSADVGTDQDTVPNASDEDDVAATTKPFGSRTLSDT
jgi:hypothetical protein